MISIWILLLSQVLVDGTFIMKEPLRLRKARFSHEDCGKEKTIVKSYHNNCFRRLKLGVMEQKNKDLEELKEMFSETRASQRIYGGRDTENGQFPWTVRIAWGNRPENSWCSGSIIHQRFILTAAHCLWNQGGKQLYVYVGVDPPISDQMSSVATQEFWIHPCYWNNQTGQYPTNYTSPEFCPDRIYKESEYFDVGLILLRNNLTDFIGRWPLHDPSKWDTYFKYNSVCLSEEFWQLDYEEVYQHSGWGLTEPSQPGQHFAHAGRLKQIKHLVRSRSFDRVRINFHNKFGHAACKGDSGSPIMVQNFDGRFYQRAVAIKLLPNTILPDNFTLGCAKTLLIAIDIYHPVVKDWIWETIFNTTQRP